MNDYSLMTIDELEDLRDKLQKQIEKLEAQKMEIGLVLQEKRAIENIDVADLAKRAEQVKVELETLKKAGLIESASLSGAAALVTESE